MRKITTIVAPTSPLLTQRLEELLQDSTFRLINIQRFNSSYEAWIEISTPNNFEDTRNADRELIDYFRYERCPRDPETAAIHEQMSRKLVDRLRGSR